MSDEPATQLELDFGPSELEAEAIAADFLARYTAPERTNGSLRPRPCRCSSPLVLPDVLAFEVRCAKCGREPRAHADAGATV